MNNSIVIILLVRVLESASDPGKQTFTLTRAPITPREVSRRYSNGRVLDVVFRNGYKKRGIWAECHVNYCLHGLRNDHTI